MEKFGKKDRSSFKYWFAHWCAFQMTALNCHAWKFKYLFHDWYKPWMKLFVSYDKVQMFHNKHSNHHLLHWFLVPNNKEADWEQMIIDWECSGFTKTACPRNAKEELERIVQTLKEKTEDNKTVRQLKMLSLLPDNDDPEQKLYEYKISMAEFKLGLALRKLGLD